MADYFRTAIRDIKLSVIQSGSKCAARILTQERYEKRRLDRPSVRLAMVTWNRSTSAIKHQRTLLWVGQCIDPLEYIY